MARDPSRCRDVTFNSMGLDGLPCIEPPQLQHRQRCCGRWHCCSLSIVPLVLSPTVCVMVVVALVAWFMIYSTASNAVEVVGHQGQLVFIKAMRDNILSLTDTVQHVHSINRPRWENTTCNGTPVNHTGSAFDAYDDVRLTLWSQVHAMREGTSTVAVAFPCGSFLGFQRIEIGNRWVLVDESTDFWMRWIQSNVWQEGWANGNDSWSKPGDLLAAGLPLNMSNRVWYTNALMNPNQSWSVIYFSLPLNELSIAAIMPVFHPSGELKLVAEAEISLQQLDSFFALLKTTANTFAFVAEMDGNLVASVPVGLSTALHSQQSATGIVETRVVAQHASDARVAGAAAWLVARYGSLAAIPVNDSSFSIRLVGEDHFLFTGHVTDSYGLHWLIVIGLPRSDLMHRLDNATLWAILMISGSLLASMLVLSATTFTIRRNLQTFAQQIKLMGNMDLEGAKRLEGVILLSEAQLILLNLRETIGNLQQFRTFLPPTMLDKVRLAETPEDPEGQPPQLGRLSSSGVLRAARSPLQDEPSQLIRPTLLTSCISPDNSLQTAIVLRDTASSSTTYISRPPHFHSIVHTMLERRMEFLSITLMCLELAHLHGVLPTSCCPSDFLLWYEACLSTALNLLQKWHGDFYRLVGDQLLFSWGAVRQSAGQCNKACHAAWHLSQALREIDAQATHQVQYVPRVSVVTGTALCGVMGTITSRDTYLIGPLVKHGARLASLNGPYDTHILVDAGVAEQCETLFRLQVCGLVHGTSGGAPRPVYELLGPTANEEGGPLAQGGEEWMYRLAAPEEGRSGYRLAMDALRRGLVPQARQNLETFLTFKPDDRHARRILERINARSADNNTLESLVD
eukprot:GGOE01028977.1.p1 GENE.GGOE01028977.1~~GGOE01028977.1.p1  ORF type:complete len:868 (-),score=217.46 GGOE01028977.1:876-3437(-)